jgi:hypothetical protein
MRGSIEGLRIRFLRANVIRFGRGKRVRCCGVGNKKIVKFRGGGWEEDRVCARKAGPGPRFGRGFLVVGEIWWREVVRLVRVRGHGDQSITRCTDGAIRSLAKAVTRHRRRVSSGRDVGNVSRVRADVAITSIAMGGVCDYFTTGESGRMVMMDQPVLSGWASCS